MTELPENNEARRALITGAAGQDGSYLAEMLIEKRDGDIAGIEPLPVNRRFNLCLKIALDNPWAADLQLTGRNAVSR